MSLLGFAAYFNGIGMKIRGKEYQIGVMRAVGTPLKRLRRKLTLDSIKIPIISSAFAYGLMRAAQQIMMNAKDRYDMLAQQAADAAGMGNIEMYKELNNKAELVGQRYLIGSQMLYVNALIPTVVIFAVICMVTILLTRRSVGGFGSNIAYSISRGRKRR
jgi:putative ABC transport system permease protein